MDPLKEEEEVEEENLDAWGEEDNEKSWSVDATPGHTQTRDGLYPCCLSQLILTVHVDNTKVPG